MFFLKKKVRNKAYVEGSIAEAYIAEELCTFCSMYFDSTFVSRFSRKSRNFDGGEIESFGRLSIFSQPGRALGGGVRRYLEDREYTAIMIYVLLNCDEVEPFVRQFEEELLKTYRNMSDEELQRKTESHFHEWFKERTKNVEDPRLRILANGPSKEITSYKKYIANGFRFHVQSEDQNKKSQNSGVMVLGSTSYGDDENNYYGVLQEIVELDFLGNDTRISMFKCLWYDIHKGMKVDRFKTVTIDTHSKLKAYEPFIFSWQAEQVCYIPSVSGKRSDWHSVLRTKARDTIDISEKDLDTYQDDFSEFDLNIVNDNTIDDVPLSSTEVTEESNVETNDSDDSGDSIDDNDSTDNNDPSDNEMGF